MSLASSPNAVVALNAPGQVGFAEKLWRINWGLALVLTAIAGIGVVALYSAAARRVDPWAARHPAASGPAFRIMLVVGLVHPQTCLALAGPDSVPSPPLPGPSA